MERKVIDLTQAKELREELMNEERIDILEKVKQINTLPNTDLTTTKFLASYFEVQDKTVEKIIERNRTELQNNGMKLYKKTEILDLIQNRQPVGLENITSKIPNRGMNLFPKRAVLNFAMLLTESKVAEEIRTMLLDNHFQLEAIHNKLKSGKEITQEDIDKSSPTYYQDKELELRKKIEELYPALGKADCEGDIEEYKRINREINSYKTQLNNLLEDKIKMITTHSTTIEDSKEVIKKLIQNIAPKIYSKFKYHEAISSTYNDLYKIVNSKLGINIRARNRNKGQSLLSVLTESELFKVEEIVRAWANDLGIDIKGIISLIGVDPKELFG